MDNSFEQGYKIGSDLGYHFTGQAANDIKLNREAKRQELELAKVKTQAAMQEMAFSKQKNEQEQNQAMLKNAVAAIYNAKNDPAAMPMAVQVIRQLSEKYYPGYSVDTFDPTDPIVNQQHLDTASAMILSATSSSADVRANPYNYKDEMAKTKLGFVRITNKATGESTPVHITELLYMFGGADGAASIIYAQRQAELEAQAKAREAELTAAEKRANIANTDADTRGKLEEQAFNRGVRQVGVEVSKANAQQDPNNPNGYLQFEVNPKTGVVTGSLNRPKSDGDGSATLPPDQYQVELKNAETGLNEIAQFDPNTKQFIHKMGLIDVNSRIANFNNVVRTGKTNDDKNANSQSYITNLQATQRGLLEAKRAGVEGADIRYNAIKQSLRNAKGNGTSQDNKTIEKAGALASATSQIKGIDSSRDVRGTGIIPNIMHNIQNYLNLDTESQEFQAELRQRANFTKDGIMNLDMLYTGRLSNKVLSYLSTGNNWDSFATNVENAMWLLDRLGKQARAYASNASPWLQVEMEDAAEQFESALANLKSTQRIYSKINDGNVGGFTVLNDGKATSVEAINSAYYNDVIWVDAGNIYLIPQQEPNANIVLSDYKYSKEEFKKLVIDKAPNTKLLPFGERNTAFSFLIKN